MKPESVRRYQEVTVHALPLLGLKESRDGIIVDRLAKDSFVVRFSPYESPLIVSSDDMTAR